VLAENERAELELAVVGLTSRFPMTRSAPAVVLTARSPRAEKALIGLSHLADNPRHDARRRRLEASNDYQSIRITVSSITAIRSPNREWIFDASFTTRRDSGGTGTGLEIVGAVMTSRGGAIPMLPTEQDAAFKPRFAAV